MQRVLSDPGFESSLDQSHGRLPYLKPAWSEETLFARAGTTGDCGGGDSDDDDDDRKANSIQVEAGSANSMVR